MESSTWGEKEREGTKEWRDEEGQKW